MRQRRRRHWRCGCGSRAVTDAIRCGGSLTSRGNSSRRSFHRMTLFSRRTPPSVRLRPSIQINFGIGAKVEGVLHSSDIFSPTTGVRTSATRPSTRISPCCSSRSSSGRRSKSEGVSGSGGRPMTRRGMLPRPQLSVPTSRHARTAPCHESCSETAGVHTLLLLSRQRQACDRIRRQAPAAAGAPSAAAAAGLAIR
jgi:hypothetical protein